MTPQRTKKHRLPKKSIAIVGDGDTERLYFADLRDCDRPDDIHIYPEIPTRIGDYSCVLDAAIALKAKGHDVVYALIDLDKVVQERQLRTYQQHKARAMKKGVTVLENNPCFEFWVLLHFKHTSKVFSGCESVVKDVKRHIPQYAKCGPNLYRTCKDRILQHAIPNAEKLEVDRELQGPGYPRAEVFKLLKWYFGRRSA